MDDRLRAEVEQGKILKCMEKPKCIHALGAVEKKKVGIVTGVSIRPITDCSRGGGASPVNDFCDKVASKFVYKSMDDVCDMLSDNAWMCSTDIADAYRGLHIYYGDRIYQGLRWNFDTGEGDEFFKDSRLCFGMASGPFVFNKISEFCY